MKIQIARRWLVVAVGLALLCGLPVIASALPVTVPALTASQLRGRILASADESYAGYAESNATFGLPLMVKIFSRGSARPALMSQFFGISSWHPDSRVLTPVRAPGTGFTVTNAGSLAGALSNLGLVALPAQLADRDRLPVQSGFQSIGVYGGGLATFVVLGVRGPAGQNLVADTLSAGGQALDVTGGTGALISAPLINAVIVRPSGFLVTFLIAGTVRAQVLEQAASTLVTDDALS